jgi:hypothetical protein
MEAAVTFAIGSRHLTHAPALVVQIILGHGPTGPWPELPGMGALGRMMEKTEVVDEREGAKRLVGRCLRGSGGRGRRLARAGVEREETRVGRQLSAPTLPTEASYRSSAPVGRRYTPPSSRSPNDTQKNGATRSIVRRGRRTFWRAINWDC